MTGEGPITVPRKPQPQSDHLGIALIILISLATMIGLIVGAAVLLRSRVPLTGLDALAMAGLVVAGLGACGLLLLGIVLHRRVNTLSERITAIDQQTAIMAEQSVARTQADTYARDMSAPPAELRDLLARIHEAMLLPDDERRRRFERMAEQEFNERLAATEHFIDSHDFHHAREELAAMAERFGRNERIIAVEERLESETQAARANDIAVITGRVDAHIAESNWDEARRAALVLGEKYPDSSRAAALIERVEQERKAFEQQNRQRMHDEIQQFVHQRRWQEALSGALTFIQAFPDGPDSDALRAQLETLQANAEIQNRQALERYIRQYIQKQQYWDALAMARRIIAEYPLSPQANALRGQLPRLEELARAQGPMT